MKNKPSQRERIEEMLLKQGFVSRNYFIDIPYNKILRLGAVINTLRTTGWSIETKEDKVDCVYVAIKTPFIKQVYKLPDGREVVNYKHN